MSRGIGKTQFKCLAVVQASAEPVTSADVAQAVFQSRRWPHVRQCWRSLRKLADRGLVMDRGRRSWGGPRLFFRKESNETS